MEIVVEKIVYPGRSLGRGGDGIAVFTEGGLPGERLDVKITKNKKTFKEAYIGKIIKSSDIRISSKCPSFGKCGGCSFQHTSYENQLKIKQTYVNELLSPFKTDIHPIVPSPNQWGYRNKMEFSFFDKDGIVSLGLHQKGEFDKYLSIPPCYIADEDFLDLSETITAFANKSKLTVYNKKTHNGFYRHLVLRKAQNSGEILVNIVTNSNNHISESIFYELVQSLKNKITSFYWTINSGVSDAVLSERTILLSGKNEIEERLKIKNRLYSFLISPFSFFQTNTSACEKLYDKVIDCFDPDKKDSVLDLYCGTGTIAIILAPYVSEVLGVDGNEEAIRNASINAEKNKIVNSSFMSMRVEKWIKECDPQKYDSIVVDPPRSGLTQKVISFILTGDFKKIVYVSCNPSTLARDLNLLIEGNKFKIEKIIPVDMFPQTYHVEMVVSLNNSGTRT
ncbi:MAG: 23S rRNA (uracil(1939)-C(5))-methyltransferase RlmD [Elusimicrobia bacterium]|nr:23S rRNA (uracil(1939)-C(5))-methyltransferase RlmD [Elusimicrobiota bacterium]